MNYKRRDFLQISGSIAAGLALVPLGHKLTPLKSAEADAEYMRKLKL